MMEFEIDIELYKVFYTVAKCGNITKAADNLYISQPAVTMNIKKLEDLLETTLFVRTKRGVILTEEGKVLYEYVTNAMENIKLGENRLTSLKNLDTGTIRIGIGTTLTKYFLVPFLQIFHEKYPNIQIHIDTGITQDILKKLEEGKLDLAIIAGDNKNYTNFNIEYYRDIQYNFFGNEKFKGLSKLDVNLEELNNYPLLLQHPYSNSRKILNAFTEKNNITLKSNMELSSYSLVIEFAKIGLGLGFVAEDFVKDEVKNKELYKINIKPEFPKHKILILTKKDYLPSFSTKKLIEIIKSQNN